MRFMWDRKNKGWMQRHQTKRSRVVTGDIEEKLAKKYTKKITWYDYSWFNKLSERRKDKILIKTPSPLSWSITFSDTRTGLLLGNREVTLFNLVPKGDLPRIHSFCCRFNGRFIVLDAFQTHGTLSYCKLIA